MSLTALLRQPTWLSILLVSGLLALVFGLTTLLKLTLCARLLIIVVVMIGVSILYVPYNAQVTAIVLSVGFISCFLLTFTLLAKQK